MVSARASTRDTPADPLDDLSERCARVDRSGGAHAGIAVPAGRSRRSISPCLRQPIESNQVRARSSSRGLDPAAFFAGRSFQPSKSLADENSSRPCAFSAPCLRAFCSVWMRAFRTARGRGEDARVVAILEDAPDPLPQPVEPARDPRREPVHTARERALVAGLGEEVQVVGLDAVLDDAEGAARPGREGSRDQSVRVRCSQRPQSIAEPQRDEHRIASRELRTLRVRERVHAGPRACDPLRDACRPSSWTRTIADVLDASCRARSSSSQIVRASSFFLARSSTPLDLVSAAFASLRLRRLLARPRPSILRSGGRAA